MQKKKEFFVCGRSRFLLLLIMSVICHRQVCEQNKMLDAAMPNSPEERSLLMNFNYLFTRNWQLIVI